jgi:hypothetical protein
MYIHVMCLCVYICVGVCMYGIHVWLYSNMHNAIKICIYVAVLRYSDMSVFFFKRLFDLLDESCMSVERMTKLEWLPQIYTLPWLTPSLDDIAFFREKNLD